MGGADTAYDLLLALAAAEGIDAIVTPDPELPSPRCASDRFQSLALRLCVFGDRLDLCRSRLISTWKLAWPGTERLAEDF